MTAITVKDTKEDVLNNFGTSFWMCLEWRWPYFWQKHFGSWMTSLSYGLLMFYSRQMLAAIVLWMRRTFDTSGCKWMQVDASRCKWMQVDASGCKWMQVYEVNENDFHLCVSAPAIYGSLQTACFHDTKRNTFDNAIIRNGKAECYIP